MFEIENCYKIIFEAMLEEAVFRCIAERMEEYTGAGIGFVTGTGKIAACSALCVRLLPVSAEKGYLTFEEYRILLDKKEDDGRYWCITSVCAGRRVAGYVVVVYGKKEEEALFQELGNILAQNVKRYFEEEQRRYVYHQSLREHMTGRMLFEENLRENPGGQDLPEGEYIVLLLHKGDGHVKESIASLRNIWNCMYIYEEEDEIMVLLYRMKDPEVESVFMAIEAEKLVCCVSEPFSEIGLCRDKKDILRRIARVEDSEGTAVLRREKEWAMQGMYTCTAHLIEAAGLSDYSIERLRQEDAKNHTELYHTLRTYLLCENNVTMASKRLHIHRNTLVYRLKQIKETMDVDMNDYEVSRELLAFIMMNDVAGQNIRRESRG
ncbi:MAG: helix-turn-helix domain-containing protein [Lachnospiraceae bacterium]